MSYSIIGGVIVMKITVFYNENGKTLQEITEQFFEEYCLNL